ncbi:MAG: outer rane autotransporter, partial [Hyphomicrobiales bacterium]|nr:outer rane autotransporter [Hyphomicrobiales bacterium]
ILGGDAGVFAVNGDIGVLHNSGTITGDIAAVGSNGQLGELTNSGTMRGAQYGVVATALYALTNSGLIRAADETGTAIFENGGAADTLLTLNAGSVLIGHVDINGGSDTLHVGNGLNLALTFDTSVPELIETDGNPYAVVGNTVYVADMGAFAAAGVATADLSGSIGDAVSGAVDKGFAEKGADGSGHYWLQGIGGFSSETANSNAVTRNRFGGFVAGADFGPDADSRFGFFAGGARGVIEDSLNSSNADSFYAGIYGANQFDDFSVKGTLRGGYTHAGNGRIVANNTVATGLETVSSAQDSYFISPGVTFVKPWVTQDLIVESSLALNYTGIFAGGFSEAGPAGASIGSTSTHVFEAKALLRLPFEKVTAGGMLTGDVHAGATGRAIIYPALSGTLAGTPQTFALASTQATAGVVAGGAVALQLVGGATLFGGIDGTFRSDNSTALTANAGFKAKF